MKETDIGDVRNPPPGFAEWAVGMGAAAITLLTALVSGLVALRSLRLVEPAVLLR